VFAPAQLVEVFVGFLPAHLTTLDGSFHPRPGVAQTNFNDCRIEFGWIPCGPDAPCLFLGELTSLHHAIELLNHT
jgi:hypothetical protein